MKKNTLLKTTLFRFVQKSKLAKYLQTISDYLLKNEDTFYQFQCSSDLMKTHTTIIKNNSSKLKAAIFTALLFVFAVSMALGQTNSIDILKKISKKTTTVNTQKLRLSTVKSLPQTSDEYIPGTSGNWVMNNKYVYRYNTSGELVSRTQFDITGTQKLQLDSMAYDSHGNQTFSGFYNRITNSWSLDVGRKYVINYNAAGQMLKETTQYYFNGSWNNEGQIIYSYHSNGQTSEETNYGWVSNAWKPILRANYTYNSQSILPTEILISRYKNGNWSAARRYTNLTFHNGDPLKFTSYTLQNRVSTTWVDTVRTNYLHDAFGGFTAINEVYKNGSWKNLYKHVVNYDSKSNFIGSRTELWQNNRWNITDEYQVLLTYNSSDDIVRKIRRDLDPTTNTLQDYHREDFANFISVTATKENIPSSNITVYPNPTSDFINVEASTQTATNIQLTDLTGRVVKTETLSTANSRIDISTLSKGIYLLTIQTEKGNQTSKIVKQ